ncbi:hypothetical protein [Streptomyces sp. 6-11-2]|uniref:effector-associated constant component EACC1 n=1 Tax=Streptomyces sp. 6-11-2 TaxID=2585753 RepID=UPI00116E081C|nr:hypothetical protein [Streptomyces sp. 6-11-2]GED85837.1 hypothetical protein TNCT6_29220 [Streptomyces sp. 6-11-2]
MAEGDGVAGRGVRVRLDGSASNKDVGALKAWLEREKPLEDLVSGGRLRIVEQPRSDVPPGRMGAGMEILLFLLGAGAEAVFDELVAQTRRAVAAWLENRRRVESGDSPRTHVDPVHHDEG